MGEEDIRARQDSIDAHILAIENKIDAHILAIENKIDALRRDIQASIESIRDNTRDTHKRLYDRVDTIEEDIRELKIEIARIVPIIAATQEHLATDIPVDVARDKAIARGVFYVIGLGVSGFIGWLFSHLGSGK